MRNSGFLNCDGLGFPERSFVWPLGNIGLIPCCGFENRTKSIAECDGGRGRLFVPLWEDGDTTTAVREKGTGLEFFAFDVEAPAKPWTLAGSEQGLLATLFFIPLNLLYDDPEDAGPAEHKALAAAAKSIGFRFFKQADGVFRDNYAKGFNAFERAYKKLIQEIDAG
jgi:hypothetical protein